MKIRGLVFILLFTTISCSGVDFVYNESKNSLNPIYNKTLYNFDGIEITSTHRHAGSFFGNNSDPLYKLNIFITEKKTKRSVQTNQAVSKLDYEMIFSYNLFNINKDCVVFDKNILSRFSYVPKSSGYNFGSDQSLLNMYDLAVKENFDQFIGFVSDRDISSCK